MTDLFFGTAGPRNADVAVVGEAWGREEDAQQAPFVGGSGHEFTRILSESGIQRPLCFLTNVIARRPANNEMWRFFEPAADKQPPLRGLHPGPVLQEALLTLHEQLRQVRPKVIIAVGNYALWALSHAASISSQLTEGRRTPAGIESWRGSMWYADALPGEMARTPMLPIIHPAAILREWSKRPITKHDLSARVPKALRGDWRPRHPPVILAPPTYQECIARLDLWLWKAEREPLALAADIETCRGHITCIGFADSTSFAMSIPFVKLTESRGFDSYWNYDQEREIRRRIRKLFMLRSVLVVGQNFLYDIQYIQHEMGVTPYLDFDTMLAHHLLFPGTPKGLDYLSSLYCEYHWYWKDDGKEWDTKGTLEQLLAYNALDCLRTFEVSLELRNLIPKAGLASQWEKERQKNLLALRMMNRGVRIDAKQRGQLALTLTAASDDLGQWLRKIIPQDTLGEVTAKTTPWYRSPTQVLTLFADILGLQVPRHRKTGRPTFGKEGIGHVRERHPELSRLLDALGLYRSVNVFHNTFVKAPLDPDGRMRCMFNTAGTETFRWSSSENAFGRGTNLQNLPKGDEE